MQRGSSRSTDCTAIPTYLVNHLGDMAKVNLYGNKRLLVVFDKWAMGAFSLDAKAVILLSL